MAITDYEIYAIAVVSETGRFQHYVMGAGQQASRNSVRAFDTYESAERSLKKMRLTYGDDCYRIVRLKYMEMIAIDD